MSDYLAHLIERSFAPAPWIRPQIASIFETPFATTAIDSPAEFAGPLETNVDPFRTSVSSDASQTPPTNSPHRDDVEPSSIGPESRAGIPTPVTRRLRPQAPADSSFIKSSAPTSVVVPQHQSNAEVSPMNLQPVGEMTADTNETSRHSTRFQLAEAALSHGPSPSSPYSPEASSARETEAPPSFDRSDGPAVRTAIRPSPATREGLFRSAPQHARKESRAFAAPASPPAAPSIQVTIGRVEVRVTSPAVPAKTTPKKEPELSLDAYLRRRSQGGGR